MLSSLLLLAGLGSPDALAGGGPANVLVIHNADDEESIEIAQYYAQARDIPLGQLCGLVGIDPLALSIPWTDYELLIREAVDDCLDAQPNPDDIDYLVLIRGLPYRVDIDDGFHTSLQAMLQVGHGVRTSDGASVAGLAQAFSGGTAYASVYNPLWPGSGGTEDYTISNPSASRYTTAPKFAELELQPRTFRRMDVAPWSGFDLSGELFLVSRLDGFDAVDALALIDRAIAADGSFPEAPITCMAAADTARGARDPECAYTIERLQDVGIPAQWIDTHDPSLSGEEVAAYLTGTTSLQDAIDGNTYVPGTFACNLTSYGAVPNNFVCDETSESCPASESQTSIARLVRAGVTGAHGTVAEPLNNSFPGAGMLLMYTMGYNMIESAQTTQIYLYWQNIYLGDPLTSPWAQRPVVALNMTQTAPVNLPLEVSASHPDGIAEIRLYINGERIQDEDGDTLSHTWDHSVGDVIDVMAIAVSKDVVLDRPGWPQSETTARPAIQGWTTAQIEISSAIEPADTGDIQDTAAPAASPDKDTSGCTCATSTGQSGWPLWVWICIAWRRRTQVQTATNTTVPSASKV